MANTIATPVYMPRESRASQERSIYVWEWNVMQNLIQKIGAQNT